MFLVMIFSCVWFEMCDLKCMCEFMVFFIVLFSFLVSCVVIVCVVIWWGCSMMIFWLVSYFLCKRLSGSVVFLFVLGGVCNMMRGCWVRVVLILGMIVWMGRVMGLGL